MTNKEFELWFQTHGIEGLKELSIKATPHKQYPHIVSLKYNQIESSMGDPVVQTCRGMVFNLTTGKVVARAFDKFFNHGEGHAAIIDWSTARCQEKLDGSLMMLYWLEDKHDWEVASSGTPDASGTMGDNTFTFADKFWGLLDKWSPSWRFFIPPDEILVFEMCTMDNRIVVAHPDERIVLIGNREHRVSGEMIEYSPQTDYSDYDVVREFPLQSLEDIEATFAAMDPMKQEGYVIVDGNFNRIKVKHPGYVAIHHCISNLTQRAIVEVVRSGEISEVIASFPEYAKKFEQTKTQFELLKRQIITSWEENKECERGKEFALKVKDLPWASILFSLKNQKIDSVEQGLKDMNLDRLMELL